MIHPSDSWSLSPQESYRSANLGRQLSEINTFTHLDIISQSAKSLNQPSTMGDLDLQCSLAQSLTSLNNPEANGIVQVHHACGDTLKISCQRTIRVPDGKGDSELPPDLGRSHCIRQLIIRQRSQMSWLLRVGFSFQCTVSCTHPTKLDKMAEMGQKEKQCGSVSSLEFPLPSAYTWGV